MQYYETSELTKEQSRKFAEWFDKEINTDREENEVDDELTYHFCSDLTSQEVKKIREFELNLLKGQ